MGSHNRSDKLHFGVDWGSHICSEINVLTSWAKSPEVGHNCRYQIYKSTYGSSRSFK